MTGRLIPSPAVAVKVLFTCEGPVVEADVAGRDSLLGTAVRKAGVVAVDAADWVRVGIVVEKDLGMGVGLFT